MHATKPPGHGQAAGGNQAWRQNQGRNRRTFAGRAQGGGAGRGIGNDSGGRDRFRNLAGGGGDRVGRGRLRVRMLGIHDGAVAGVALDLGRDPVHDLDSLHGKIARCRFPRQHHRIGTIIDSGRDIGNLRPRRHRRRNHAFQHLGRHHHRLAGAPGAADQILLQGGDILYRQFHAEVAARHHDRIGQFNNLVDLMQGGRLLDLCQHRRPARDQAPGLGDIIGPLHERQRHPIDAGIKRETQIRLILGGHRAHGQQCLRQVDALAVGQAAPRHDLAGGEIIAKLFDRQSQSAVVDQKIHAFFQGRENFRMRQRRPRLVPRLVRQIEPIRSADGEIDAIALDGADADFRALQIGHDADRRSGRLLHGANGLEPGKMIGMLAVAEIKPEQIRPRRVKSGDGLLIAAGGAKGRNYFGRTVSLHRHSLHGINQNCAKVVYIRQGRTANHQIIQGIKQGISIVVGQQGARVQAGGGGAGQGIGHDDGTGIVFRAVNAVGVAGNGANAGTAAKRQGQTSQVFEIASAAALTAHRDRRLAAG